MVGHFGMNEKKPRDIITDVLPFIQHNHDFFFFTHYYGKVLKTGCAFKFAIAHIYAA